MGDAMRDEAAGRHRIHFLLAKDKSPAMSIPLPGELVAVKLTEPLTQLQPQVRIRRVGCSRVKS